MQGALPRLWPAEAFVSNQLCNGKQLHPSLRQRSGRQRLLLLHSELQLSTDYRSWATLHGPTAAERMRVDGHRGFANFPPETASNSAPQFHCIRKHLVWQGPLLQDFINSDKSEADTVWRGALPEKLSRSDLRGTQTSWPQDPLHSEENMKAHTFSSLQENGLEGTAGFGLRAGHKLAVCSWEVSQLTAALSPPLHAHRFATLLPAASPQETDANYQWRKWPSWC